MPRFILKKSEMCNNTVSVEYACWYPEMPACEPELSGLWIVNAKVLTHADYETSDPLTGTATYNGIACKVAPAE
jgi:thiosulfate reductase / polysulfide reductase chain A